nr:gibberellin receptor GID1B-like [Tanacetum cinerariifolium]
MLNQSGLPINLWGEALLAACHIHNRITSHVISMSPYELWNGRKLNLDYFRVWGCLAYYRTPEPKRSKLGARGNKSVFVGYAKNSKAYRLLDENSGVIIESREVEFFEDKLSKDVKNPRASLVPTSTSSSPVEISTEINEPRRSTRARKEKSLGSDFFSYLVEGTQNKVTKEEVVNDEMDSILGNQTWELADLHKGVKPIRSKWESNVPFEPSVHLEKNSSRVVAQLKYASVVSCVMYAMHCTRPDIAFVVSDSKSMSGWIYTLAGGVVSWASKKQTCISHSTMEPEFIALAAAGKEAEWMQDLLMDIQLWPGPMPSIPIVGAALNREFVVSLLESHDSGLSAWSYSRLLPPSCCNRKLLLLNDYLCRIVLIMGAKAWRLKQLTECRIVVCFGFGFGLIEAFSVAGSFGTKMYMGLKAMMKNILMLLVLVLFVFKFHEFKYEKRTGKQSVVDLNEDDEMESRRSITRWNNNEEILQAESWIEHSPDANIKKDQHDDIYWNLILGDFNSRTTAPPHNLQELFGPDPKERPVGKQRAPKNNQINANEAKKVVPLHTWILISNFKLAYNMLRRPDGLIKGVVVSVNYRRSPEHRFPCAYEDGWEALKWVDSRKWLKSGKDSKVRIFLAGDSSGGNIAHHVAVRAAGSGIDVIGNILLHPLFGGEERTESENKLDGKYFVRVQDRDWYWRAFLPEGEDRDHPACNIFGPRGIDIKGVKFPKSLVVVAGFDLVQDWQLAYVKGLENAGQDVKLLFLQKATIGFYFLPNNEHFYTLMDEIENFVAKV